MPKLEIRELDVGQYRVKYREWTRREVKHMDSDELEDFMVDTVIQSIVDTSDGDAAVEPDDLPMGDLVAVIVAIADGLAPNGSAGSARRRRIRA